MCLCGGVCNKYSLPPRLPSHSLLVGFTRLKAIFIGLGLAVPLLIQPKKEWGKCSSVVRAFDCRWRGCLIDFLSVFSFGWKCLLNETDTQTHTHTYTHTHTHTDRQTSTLVCPCCVYLMEGEFLFYCLGSKVNKELLAILSKLCSPSVFSPLARRTWLLSWVATVIHELTNELLLIDNPLGSFASPVLSPSLNSPIFHPSLSLHGIAKTNTPNPALKICNYWQGNPLMSQQQWFEIPTGFQGRMIYWLID